MSWGIIYFATPALRRRPEAPDAWLVFRHEVGEVARLTRLQHLVRDQRDLVLDALLDGQPVQVLEHWCYVVAPVGLRDYASERVLDGLQLLDVGDFGAVEQRVAVVEPGADDAARDGIRHFTVQHWSSDVQQRSDVEVARLDDALYMLVEG